MDGVSETPAYLNCDQEIKLKMADVESTIKERETTSLLLLSTSPSARALSEALLLRAEYSSPNQVPLQQSDPIDDNQIKMGSEIVDTIKSVNPVDDQSPEIKSSTANTNSGSSPPSMAAAMASRIADDIQRACDSYTHDVDARHIGLLLSLAKLPDAPLAAIFSSLLKLLKIHSWDTATAGVSWPCDPLPSSALERDLQVTSQSAVWQLRKQFSSSSSGNNNQSSNPPPMIISAPSSFSSNAGAGLTFVTSSRLSLLESAIFIPLPNVDNPLLLADPSAASGGGAGNKIKMRRFSLAFWLKFERDLKDVKMAPTTSSSGTTGVGGANRRQTSPSNNSEKQISLHLISVLFNNHTTLLELWFDLVGAKFHIKLVKLSDSNNLNLNQKQNGGKSNRGSGRVNHNQSSAHGIGRLLGFQNVSCPREVLDHEWHLVSLNVIIESNGGGSGGGGKSSSNNQQNAHNQTIKLALSTDAQEIAQTQFHFPAPAAISPSTAPSSDESSSGILFGSLSNTISHACYQTSNLFLLRTTLPVEACLHLLVLGPQFAEYSLTQLAPATHDGSALCLEHVPWNRHFCSPTTPLHTVALLSLSGDTFKFLCDHMAAIYAPSSGKSFITWYATEAGLNLIAQLNTSSSAGGGIGSALSNHSPSMGALGLGLGLGSLRFPSSTSTDPSRITSSSAMGAATLMDVNQLPVCMFGTFQVHEGHSLSAAVAALGGLNPFLILPLQVIEQNLNHNQKQNGGHDVTSSDLLQATALEVVLTVAHLDANLWQQFVTQLAGFELLNFLLRNERVHISLSLFEVYLKFACSHVTAPSSAFIGSKIVFAQLLALWPAWRRNSSVLERWAATLEALTSERNPHHQFNTSLVRRCNALQIILDLFHEIYVLSPAVADGKNKMAADEVNHLSDKLISNLTRTVARLIGVNTPDTEGVRRLMDTILLLHRPTHCHVTASRTSFYYLFNSHFGPNGETIGPLAQTTSRLHTHKRERGQRGHRTSTTPNVSEHGGEYANPKIQNGAQQQQSADQIAQTINDKENINPIQTPPPAAASPSTSDEWEILTHSSDVDLDLDSDLDGEVKGHHRTTATNSSSSIDKLLARLLSVLTDAVLASAVSGLDELIALLPYETLVVLLNNSCCVVREETLRLISVCLRRVTCAGKEYLIAGLWRNKGFHLMANQLHKYRATSRLITISLALIFDCDLDDQDQDGGGHDDERHFDFEQELFLSRFGAKLNATQLQGFVLLFALLPRRISSPSSTGHENQNGGDDFNMITRTTTIERPLQMLVHIIVKLSSSALKLLIDLGLVESLIKVALELEPINCALQLQGHVTNKMADTSGGAGDGGDASAGEPESMGGAFAPPPIAPPPLQTFVCPAMRSIQSMLEIVGVIFSGLAGAANYQVFTDVVDLFVALLSRLSVTSDHYLTLRCLLMSFLEAGLNSALICLSDANFITGTGSGTGTGSSRTSGTGVTGTGGPVGQNALLFDTTSLESRLSLSSMDVNDAFELNNWKKNRPTPSEFTSRLADLMARVDEVIRYRVADAPVPAREREFIRAYVGWLLTCHVHASRGTSGGSNSTWRRTMGRNVLKNVQRQTRTSLMNLILFCLSSMMELDDRALFLHHLATGVGFKALGEIIPPESTSSEFFIVLDAFCADIRARNQFAPRECDAIDALVCHLIPVSIRSASANTSTKPNSLARSYSPPFSSMSYNTNEETISSYNENHSQVGKHELAQWFEELNRGRAAHLADRRSADKKVFSKFETLADRVSESALLVTRSANGSQAAARKSFLAALKESASRDFWTRSRWRAAIDRLAHERGLWHCAAAAPSSWEMDPTEGPSRIRRRLRRTHLCIPRKFFLSKEVPPPGSGVELFSFLFNGSHSSSATHARTCPNLSVPKDLNSAGAAAARGGTRTEIATEAQEEQDEADAQDEHELNLTLIDSINSNGRISYTCPCVLVTPPAEYRGEILIGSSFVHLIAHAGASAGGTSSSSESYRPKSSKRTSNRKSPSLAGLVTEMWPFEQIAELHRRRYALRNHALEIFLTNGATHLIAFKSTRFREDFLAALLTRPLPSLLEGHTLIGVTHAWRDGHITNFEYLTALNKYAGRSFNDLMQYPVMPFIVRDYESAALDLTRPNTFRNLSRPMAVQHKEKEKFYAEQYAYLAQETERLEALTAASPGARSSIPMPLTGPYHYGSHYSNSGVVLHFLVRLPPYTQMFLTYQDNNFDLPDRTFHALATTWRLTSGESQTDFKELVPEFFFLPEFLDNHERFDFGLRQSGDRVDGVALPAWCRNSSRLFVLVHRQALECAHVTESLHSWIDLIFGFRQTGRAAVEATNVYHPATYYGAASDTANVEDDLKRSALETMIRTYGQMPVQLFSTAHPPVSAAVARAQHAQHQTALCDIISPLGDHVVGLQWGALVGSPAEPNPAVLAKRTLTPQASVALAAASGTKVKGQVGLQGAAPGGGALRPIQLVPLSTNDVLLLPDASSLLLSYSRQKGGALVNSVYITSIASIYWTADSVSAPPRRSTVSESIQNGGGGASRTSTIQNGGAGGGVSASVLRIRFHIPQKSARTYPFVALMGALDRITLCASVPECAVLFVGHATGVIVALRLTTPFTSESRLTSPPVSMLAHTAAITALCISREWSVAVSASADGTAIIWDLNSLTYVRTLDEHGDQSTSSGARSVRLVAVSPTLGDVVTVSHTPRPTSTSSASGGASRRKSSTRSPPSSTSTGTGSGSGTAADPFADLLGSRLVVNTINGVRVGSVETEVPITAVAYSSAPEGVSVNLIAGGLADGSIKLWSSWDLLPVREMKLTRFDRPIISVCYCKNSQFLCAANDEGTIVIWGRPGTKSSIPQLISLA